MCFNQLLLELDELALRERCLGTIRKPVGDDSQLHAVYRACFFNTAQNDRNPMTTGDRDYLNTKMLRECLVTQWKTGLGVEGKRVFFRLLS